MKGAWKILPGKIAAAEACGANILSRLQAALQTKGHATLAVSGGTSPKAMFEFMARSDLDWSRVHLFWVDERAVPPDHEQSNHRLVNECLIQPARLAGTNVHRVLAELPPREAASRYRRELLECAELTTDGNPRFDVVHLGMGADAHTASLFPGEPLIDDREGLAAEVYVEKIPQWRITLLPRVLLAAHHVALLVTGQDKESALKQVFEADYDPKRFPAQLIAYQSTVAAWFFDRAAVGSLDSSMFNMPSNEGRQNGAD
jgi:6-phosphogluconolactonase